MNENLDYFFGNILDCLNYYLHTTFPDVKDYYSDKPYGILLKNGFDFIKNGPSKSTLTAYLEYEKIKIINKFNLNDSELLEVILMEKIILCIHFGNICEIANIVQNFASNKIYEKYSKIITLLRETGF